MSWRLVLSSQFFVPFLPIRSVEEKQEISCDGYFKSCFEFPLLCVSCHLDAKTLLERHQPPPFNNHLIAPLRTECTDHAHLEVMCNTIYCQNWSTGVKVFYIQTRHYRLYSVQVWLVRLRSPVAGFKNFPISIYIGHEPVEKGSDICSSEVSGE